MTTWWRGDYADIRETIRRTGRLEVSETLAVSDLDAGWHYHAQNDHTTINGDRDGWPVRATLHQRRARRRDGRRRKQLLATQAFYESTKEERRKAEEARVALYRKQQEEQRKRLLAVQAEQEKARAAREAVARMEREAAEEQRQYAFDAWAEQERREIAARARAVISGTILSDDLQALWIRPPMYLNEDQKITLADGLERMFVARGAGPLRVSHDRAIEVSRLSPRELALAKHDWYRTNYDNLCTQYPPRYR
jgi:hypothetical protein